MATAVVPPGGQPPSLPTRVVGFYNGVLAELKRVTWPDFPQVRSATVAIIIFVLFLALIISALDFVLNGLLIRLLPSLFAK
jgi:preprotein translocase subunit SecE